jgi:hypothetical protein
MEDSLDWGNSVHGNKGGEKATDKGYMRPRSYPGGIIGNRCCQLGSGPVEIEGKAIVGKKSGIQLMRNCNSGNSSGNIHLVGVIVVPVIPVQIIKAAYPPNQHSDEYKEGAQVIFAEQGMVQNATPGTAFTGNDHDM